MGFEPLSRAEFKFEPIGGQSPAGGLCEAYVSSVAVDNQPAPQWRFFQHQLGLQHWVTVGRGPTEDIVDELGEFKATLLKPTSSFSKDAWLEELAHESPPFDEVS